MSQTTPPPENSTPPGGSTPPGPTPAEYSAASAPPPPPPPPAAPGASPYGAPASATATPGAMNPVLARFLARLIDGLIIGIASAIINRIILRPIIDPGVITSFSDFAGRVFLYLAISAVLTTVIYLGYFGFMESSQGKTVGKMALKLRVESLSGGNPTLQQAIKRNIWLGAAILGVLPVLGSLLAGLIELVAAILIAVQINSDPENRPWTDRFAGTRVVQEG